MGSTSHKVCYNLGSHLIVEPFTPWIPQLEGMAFEGFCPAPVSPGRVVHLHPLPPTKLNQLSLREALGPRDGAWAASCSVLPSTPAFGTGLLLLWGPQISFQLLQTLELVTSFSHQCRSWIGVRVETGLPHLLALASLSPLE